MDFEACFYKPVVETSVKLNVRRSAMHTVSTHSFPDLATLNEALWSEADIALKDREAICRELKTGRIVYVAPELKAEVLRLIDNTKWLILLVCRLSKLIPSNNQMPRLKALAFKVKETADFLLIHEMANEK
jgi:hypothetical protein